MREVWLAVVLVGVATIALKALGPAAFGGRELPPRLGSVLALLAPAVLAALVVTQTVGGARGEVVLDERLAGVAAAAVALLLRAPLLLVIAVAAAVTAALRAL